MELDSKVIFSRDEFVVTLRMEPDDDVSPEEFECYDQSDLSAWRNGQWQYVTVSAHVEWDGVEIGSDSTGGVEHGSLPEVEADAFEMTPGRTEGNAVHMGSTAWHVTVQALSNAGDWLTRVCDRGYVATALQSIDAPVQPVMRATGLIDAEYDSATEEWTVYARADASQDWWRLEGDPLATLLGLAHDIATGG